MADSSREAEAEAPADVERGRAAVSVEASSVPGESQGIGEHDGQDPHSRDAEDSGSISSSSVGLSVDDDDSDASSALGDMGIPSSSVSATSSVYHFVEEFGRTFHKYKEGKYYLPNDEQEQNRLDLQHALARRLLDNKLHLAPIERPHRVLDIGTGTGLWAIEFAEQHPESEVLGTDLSPIQPEYVPPNLRFEVDDVEDEWVYHTQFDFIHGRYICIFLTDVPKLLRNIYDSLKPGGYVEIMETVMTQKAIDSSLEGSVIKKWNDMIVEGVRKTGRDPGCPVHVKRWMEQAGFANVTEKKFAVPINPWAKGREQKIRGAMMMTNVLEVAQGITMNIFTKVHGWLQEEVEVFLVDVREELKNRDRHGYVPVLCVYGQKPE